VPDIVLRTASDARREDSRQDDSSGSAHGSPVTGSRYETLGYSADARLNAQLGFRFLFFFFCLKNRFPGASADRRACWNVT